jgi:dihydroorotase-like cyclic amidohydrolase
LMLTDVHKGSIRIERLVQMLTETPARILGLYPEKGAVMPGSWADIVLVDPAKKVVPSDEAMESKSGWTPYAGWELTGAAVMTMLRGTVIAKDGKVLGEPGAGRYIAGRAQNFAARNPAVNQGLSLELR